MKSIMQNVYKMHLMILMSLFLNSSKGIRTVHQKVNSWQENGRKRISVAKIESIVV